MRHAVGCAGLWLTVPHDENVFVRQSDACQRQRFINGLANGKHMCDAVPARAVRFKDVVLYAQGFFNGERASHYLLA
jgi:hypothetical protein